MKRASWLGAVLCVALLARAGQADDGDDEVRAVVERVRAAWDGTRALTAYHVDRDRAGAATDALAHLCALYGAEAHDRRDFLSRSAKAEDDAFATAMSALRPLETYATSGQYAATRALRDKVGAQLAKLRQDARDKREDFQKRWREGADKVKRELLDGIFSPRGREEMERIALVRVLTDARQQIERLFGTDSGRLPAPQRDRLRAALADGLGPWKGLLESEEREAGRDLEALKQRDELARCWVE
jgi:DNA-binding TFAR19-related protein (PDSD5 family)